MDSLLHVKIFFSCPSYDSKKRPSVIKLHSHRDARRVRKRPGCCDQALSSAIFSLAINRPGLLGIVADKSAVSGKTLTTNKKKEDSETKLLMFKRDKLFLLISLPTVAPSLNYHFKRGVEKAILQLTGLTGAGGTEELSSDKTCVSIGFENESLDSRCSFQLTYPRYTRVQCTFSGCFFFFSFFIGHMQELCPARTAPSSCSTWQTLNTYSIRYTCYHSNCQRQALRSVNSEPRRGVYKCVHPGGAVTNNMLVLRKNDNMRNIKSILTSTNHLIAHIILSAESPE